MGKRGSFGELEDCQGEAAGRRPSRGAGFTGLSLKLFYTFDRILTGFNRFYTWVKLALLYEYMVLYCTLLTYVAKHGCQPSWSSITKCANKRRWTATAKGQRKWRQKDHEYILDRSSLTDSTLSHRLALTAVHHFTVKFHRRNLFRENAEVQSTGPTYKGTKCTEGTRPNPKVKCNFPLKNTYNILFVNFIQGL